MKQTDPKFDAVAAGHRPPVAGFLRGTACFLLALVVFGGAAPAQVPQPQNHVEDRAGVLDRGGEKRLDDVLTELEQKTGAQVIVLTIDSTGGQDIKAYAVGLFKQWKLGKAGQNNGVLVVVAVKDRKYAIEVGYGLEPVLTDAFTGSIGREHFQPNFRKGDYTRGIADGVLALVARVAENSNVQLSAAPAPRRNGGARSTPNAKSGSAFGLFMTLLVILIVLSILGRLGRRARGYNRWSGVSRGGMPWWMWWMLMNQMGNTHRRNRHGGGWGGGWGGGLGGGGWGGGGGGFGGGSFGGGGGGSSGGGGASGGW